MGFRALRDKAADIGNQFLREVISALADFKEINELDTTQISASQLFFSDLTKFKKTYVKEWYDKGIRTFNDLLRQDGSQSACATNFVAIGASVS